MALTFELDTTMSRELYEGICALWVDVTNAGGAVGFVPPVSSEDVRPELALRLSAIAEGDTRLLVGREDGGAVAATAFFTFNTHRLMRHWCWLYTVMVHPKHQGNGYGRDLMAAAQEVARGMDGLAGIRLTCRGGTGVEHFYAACGYQEVGRVPAAIKVGDGDFRDDITMWLPL
jgi:GNAT superfamily N-acetyltransferase